MAADDDADRYSSRTPAGRTLLALATLARRAVGALGTDPGVALDRRAGHRGAARAGGRRTAAGRGGRGRATASRGRSPTCSSRPSGCRRSWTAAGGDSGARHGGVANLAGVSSPARSATLRDALGLGVAVGLYGAAFGAAADAAGLNVWQAMTLSALMFTGASQFALVGVLGAGRQRARRRRQRAAARHPQHRLRRPARPAAAAARALRRVGTAHWVIDETTAMSLAAPDRALGRLAFLVDRRVDLPDVERDDRGRRARRRGARRDGAGGARRRRPGGLPRPAVAAAADGVPRGGRPAPGRARRRGRRAGADAVRAGRRAGDRRRRRRRAGRPAARHRAPDGAEEMA